MSPTLFHQQLNRLLSTKLSLVLPTFFAGVDAPLHINLLVRASEGWRGLGRVGKGQGGLKSVGNGQGRGGCYKGPGSITEGQEEFKRTRECCRCPGRKSEYVTEVQGVLEWAMEC